MQKERMTLEKIRKRRRRMRWLNQHRYYIAAAAVFFVISAVVAITAATMTINGGQKQQAAEPEPERTKLTAGAASILEDCQSQPEPQPTYQSMIYSYDWDAEDAELLLKIAMAEAESESTEGKAMVMLVVLNRTWSKDFPNSVEEVIFQTEPTRQFSVTEPGGRWYTTEPDEDCIKALQLIESGWDESWGALYFESCGNDPSWHSKNLDFLFQMGKHKFYK